jgi:hypothetical protein
MNSGQWHSEGSYGVGDEPAFGQMAIQNQNQEQGCSRSLLLSQHTVTAALQGGT